MFLVEITCMLYIGSRKIRFQRVLHCIIATKYCVCVCVCVFFPFILDFNGAGVTQEEGNTGFSTHLLSVVLALIFLARRIQPFLSLVDREVEFCVLTI